MILADVFAWLDRSKISFPQLRADFANGFSFCRIPGKAHNQTISELVARLVAVNVGYNHGGRACAVKLINEPSRLRPGGIARWLKPAQRPASLVAVLRLQPSPRLGAVLLVQERADEEAMNMPLRRVVVQGQLRRFTSKLRQRFIFRRCLAIHVCADGSAVQIEPFRKQRPVAKPDAISPVEPAMHGRDFQLQPSVVMPGPLNPRAVDHSVFAEQLSSFIPLPADAVKQPGPVWFLAGEKPVLVPGAGGAVQAVLSQGHLLAELTASIIMALNGAVLHSRISRETNPWRGESSCSFVTFRDPANSSRERFLPRLAFDRNCALASRPATVPGDENLEAEAPGGGGRVKEERKPMNRSILDASDAAIQSKLVSSCGHRAWSNDSSRSVF